MFEALSTIIAIGSLIAIIAFFVLLFSTVFDAWKLQDISLIVLGISMFIPVISLIVITLL